MKKFAFISPHVPSVEQVALAAEKEIELVHVGDRDAFTLDPFEFTPFRGVIVVHPAAALRALAVVEYIGIFENSNRAPEGDPPKFQASALHIFWLVAGDRGLVVYQNDSHNSPVSRDSSYGGER